MRHVDVSATCIWDDMTPLFLLPLLNFETAVLSPETLMQHLGARSLAETWCVASWGQLPSACWQSPACGPPGPGGRLNLLGDPIECGPSQE